MKFFRTMEVMGMMILLPSTHSRIRGNGGDYETSSCYVTPSCTATEFYDKTTGFTNDTGWDLNADVCCQICLPDKDCQSKTGNGDYDFLLLSQIWQPQFCSSLSHGYDPTLTHLSGTTCSHDAPNDLRIHGLWPNYVNGYPQCCNSTAAPSYTLDPSLIIEWSIYPAMQASFAGVMPLEMCSVCSTISHEWLKHGGCYSPGDPIKYFTDTVALHNSLKKATEQINSLKGKILETSYLRSLYPKSANIICDYRTPSPYGKETGMMLEIRTCWSRDHEPIDCPADSGSCPKFTSIEV